MKSSLFRISFSDLYRIEQTIPVGRDLHDHPVQPSDHFRAGQKLVQVIKGIVQMPPKHWQAWGIKHLSRKSAPILEHPLCKVKQRPSLSPLGR